LQHCFPDWGSRYFRSAHNLPSRTILLPTFYMSDSESHSLSEVSHTYAENSDSDHGSQLSVLWVPEYVSSPLCVSRRSPFRPLPIPHGWRQFVHFDGSIYYHHAEKSILTDDDIYKSHILSEVYKQYDEHVVWLDLVREHEQDPAAEMVVVVTTVFYFSLISWSSGREYEWDDDNSKRESSAYALFLLCGCTQDCVHIRRLRSGNVLHSIQCTALTFLRSWRRTFCRPWRTVLMASFCVCPSRARIILIPVLSERVLDVKNTTFPYEDVHVARLIQVYQDLRGI
jgi:hypothetical protein